MSKDKTWSGRFNEPVSELVKNIPARLILTNGWQNGTSKARWHTRKC